MLYKMLKWDEDEWVNAFVLLPSLASFKPKLNRKCWVISHHTDRDVYDFWTVPAEKLSG